MVQGTGSELVALARCGDKAAFSHLIERHQFVAFHLARNMVAKTDIAQDLVQEAFLQAYLSLDRLREVDRFQSWLYGIVLNVCRSYIRHQKVTLISFEEIAGGLKVELNPFIAISPDPMKVAEEQEFYGLVLEAVNTLSAKNRTATLLFYFEQLTLHEIAALLDISVTAVKGRLHKARSQLKEQLLPLYIDNDPIVLKPQRSYSMIKMTIADVIPNPDQDNNPKSYIVVLWDEVSRQFLPIWVGLWSGEAIAQILNETSLPRPMTFQFMANLLNAATVELESVRIEAIREITYYATASLRCGQQVREVDARPSDAISLALYMNRPIYVTQEVMEQQGMTVLPEIESLPLGRGLAYFRGKQEKKQKEADVSSKEAAAWERTEQYQKVMSFLFGGD